MSVAQEFKASNDSFKKTFDKGHLAIPPARKVLVVTCMDARVEPISQLGLNVGDAHIVRNAGGRVQDALRSIAISQQFLGTTEVAVYHHTDCGMLTFKNSDLHSKFKGQGVDASHVDFLPFPDLEQSVKDDVSTLQSEKGKLLLPDTKLSGWVYSVHDGGVTQVV